MAAKVSTAPVLAAEQHVHLPDPGAPERVQERALDVRLVQLLLAHEERLVDAVLRIAASAAEASQLEAKRWKQVHRLQLELLEEREERARERAKDAARTHKDESADELKDAAADILLQKAASMLGLEAGVDAIPSEAMADVVGAVAGMGGE